jgi:hypothetical protein
MIAGIGKNAVWSGFLLQLPNATDTLTPAIKSYFPPPASSLVTSAWESDQISR